MSACLRKFVRFLVLPAGLSLIVGLHWSNTKAGQDNFDMHAGPSPPQEPDKKSRSPLRNDRNAPLSQGVSMRVGTAGTDQFGYALDATIPFSWTSPISGTQVIFSGEDDSITGTIDIGFHFPFYENAYSQLSISTNGVIFLGSGSTDPNNQPAPQDTPPNNYIAPFWDDLVVGGSFNPGNVRYLSGGSAPDRFFVVAWNDVTRLGSSDALTFEAVLHESGDIEFQYLVMGGDLEQATVGIEDADGMDGLVYLHNAPGLGDAQAVRFVRPPAGPRVKTLLAYQSGFTGQGAGSFQIALRNTGEVGVDTFNLETSAIDPTWSIALRGADGMTDLADTDINGQPDTGPVGQGETITITVVVTASESLVEGDFQEVALAASSALDASKQVTTTLTAAIPAPFVQAASASQSGRVLSYLWSENQIDTLLTPEFDISSIEVISARAGSYLAAWENRGVGGAGLFSNIEYSLIDRAGAVIYPVAAIQDNSQAGMQTQDRYVSAAAAPDGRIGLVWVRDLLNTSIFKTNSNVYFAVLSPSGVLEQGPVNVTMNSGWRGDSDLDVPSFLSPRITATANNRFVLAWIDDRDQPGGQASDVAVAVFGATGQQVAPPAALTQSVAGGDRYLDPSLTRVNNDRVFLVFSQLDPTSFAYSLHFVVLDNAGTAVQPETPIAGGSGWGADAVQFQSENLIVGWTNPVDSRIEYLVLEPVSFSVVSGPFQFDSPDGRPSDFVSISTTEAGLAALTWMDAVWNQRLYYAAVDASGGLVTPPLILSRSSSAGSTLIASLNGQGNAPYQTAWKVYLPSILR